MDQVAEFAAAYPAWMVPAGLFWRRDAGYPASWRHFIYGLEALHRRAAREDLRQASAARTAFGSSGDTVDEWYQVKNAQAGWM